MYTYVYVVYDHDHVSKGREIKKSVAGDFFVIGSNRIGRRGDGKKNSRVGEDI